MFSLITTISGQNISTTQSTSLLQLILVNTMAAFLVLRQQLRKSQHGWGDLFCSTARWIPLLPAFALIMIGEVILASETDNGLSSILPVPSWLSEYAASLGNLADHPLSSPFVLIVVAAVTEELLFRGLILRGLLNMIAPTSAIAISAGLFAFMHLNPWQMPVAFMLGVLLGWVFQRTHSLALCIAGHGFHNMIVLLATGLPFTITGFNSPFSSEGIFTQPWWFNMMGLAALVVGVYLFNRSIPVTIPALVAKPSAPLMQESR